MLKLPNEVAERQLACDGQRCCKPIAAVQYADPVRRVYAKLVPNDAIYAQQWALSDPVGGINASGRVGAADGQRRDCRSP